MYVRSASGTRTEPSACWCVSRMATSQRVVASVPLSVATERVAPSVRSRMLRRRAWNVVQFDVDVSFVDSVRYQTFSMSARPAPVTDELSQVELRKLELARHICLELTVHTQIEEEIFYPALRGQIRDEDLLDGAVQQVFFGNHRRFGEKQIKQSQNCCFWWVRRLILY